MKTEKAEILNQKREATNWGTGMSHNFQFHMRITQNESNLNESTFPLHSYAFDISSEPEARALFFFCSGYISTQSSCIVFCMEKILCVFFSSVRSTSSSWSPQYYTHSCTVYITKQLVATTKYWNVACIFSWNFNIAGRRV